MEAIYVILLIALIFWLFGHTGSWGSLAKAYKKNVWSGSPEGDRTHVPIWSWSMVLAVSSSGERIKTGVSNIVVSPTGLHLIQNLFIQPLVPSLFIKWSDITRYTNEGNSVRLELANSNFVDVLIPTKYLPGFEQKYNKANHNAR